jgi:hypothetical protein
MLRELADYTEQLQVRTAELKTVAAPVRDVLPIPDIEAMMINRLDSDQRPDGTAEERSAYEQANFPKVAYYGKRF